MAGLLNKLRMMDAAPAKPAPAAQKTRESTTSFYHKEDIFPVSLFPDRDCLASGLLRQVFGGDFPDNVSPEDILFFDTETTGLSGGVGTVAFQLGLGYFTPSGFVVEQMLMHDYPEEPEMLALLASRFRRFPVLCSFNGKTFDVPLIRSRFLMNRLKDDCIPESHADVLYPARRIWKLRLRQCNLGNLETQLLGVQREDDLPGYLVPQTYFQYLKDGNFEPLQGILNHNKQDIISLAQLFFFLLNQVQQPESMEEKEDLFSWARSLEKQGQRQKTAHLYRLCSGSAIQGDAFKALSRLEKQDGNYHSSVLLLETMLREGNDRVYACEALAKLYEHQLRDISKALSYTRQALLYLAEPSLRQGEAVQERKNALQYRYERLRRKLSRSSQSI
ncbi:MAG: hypothetical protein E7331_01155 [Clostridiales bacterium]|nr:hypothetical protein [Clostridiales bacterium]